MIEIVDVAVGPNACPLSSRICIDIKYVSKVEIEEVTFVAKVRVVSSISHSRSRASLKRLFPDAQYIPDIVEKKNQGS